MKTLAMLKMEKNFVAVIEKKYPRKPYEVLTTEYLLKRLSQENIELIQAFTNLDREEMQKELADMSNLIDYIFERISEGFLK